MAHRLFSLALLLAVASVAPAGRSGAREAPVLPEIRQHLADGWACLQSDPAMARAHAMAVLGGQDVSVEVVLDDVPAGRRTACRAAADEALEAWERAIGDGFRLRRAEDGHHCDIVVRFRPDVRERGEVVAGFVNWKRTTDAAGARVTGDVQIRTVNLDGAAMPLRAMRHIVLHEMGHMLGLDDSNEAGDAMAPLDVSRPVAAPSDVEAAAVRGLRADAERLLHDAR